MSLTVDDLSCRRDGRLVFAALSFALGPGEARLLRGPNGAGKSSLLRILAGLLPASGGRVALDGIPVTDRDGWAERIAYAGHLDAIKPQLGVAENLGFWAALEGSGRVEEALDAFGLAALASRRAGACSAGQKRRLGLARLLLAPRRLWLLDEPTVALDAAATERFGALVRDHLDRGGMALIATHVDLDLPQAAPILLGAAPPAPGQPVEADPFLAGAFT
jgi:heme exporter protein A